MQCVGAKSWLQPIYIMTNLWFIGVILLTLLAMIVT
jgi:hypothetical protein